MGRLVCDEFGARDKMSHEVLRIDQAMPPPPVVSAIVLDMVSAYLAPILPCPDSMQLPPLQPFRYEPRADSTPMPDGPLTFRDVLRHLAKHPEQALARRPQWCGVVASALDKGRSPKMWIGHVASEVDPHPPSLGPVIWGHLERLRWDPLKTFDEMTARTRLSKPICHVNTCSKLCAPWAVRWVYVICDDGLAVAVTLCEIDGPTGDTLYRHEYLDFLPYGGNEPDWRGLAIEAWHMKQLPWVPSEERELL